MSQIIPIKDLRDTNKISEICHSSDEPLFITKNGYADLVIMSNDYYRSITQNSNIQPSYNKVPSRPLNKFEYKILDKDFFGYIRVGAASFDIKVGDVSHNLEEIKKYIDMAEAKEVKVLVFPELCLSGYTCGDLFYQSDLLNQCESALLDLTSYSKDKDIVFIIGAPLRKDSRIYNTAVVIYKGEILGVYAKKHLPHQNEYYENRQFDAYQGENSTIVIGDKEYIFGNKFIFQDLEHYKFAFGVEICEDLWSTVTPSTSMALKGASLIFNLSASNETLGKEEYRRDLIKSTSARLISGYTYCSSGPSESTQDLIFSSYKGIYENGNLLNEGRMFMDGLIYSEIDIESLENERIHASSFLSELNEDIDIVPFKMALKNPPLSRKIKQNPFIYDDNSVYEKVIYMQALGLRKRLSATKIDKVVLGLSGGLDSTLALFVCIETFKLLNIPLKNIYVLTEPAFGTSDETHDNVLELANKLDVSFMEIDIKKSVLQHLSDLGHDVNDKNVVYENAQARERTQVLFDYANEIGGLVVGTGDLSELCLGWTTFNGDHMSNYNVNVSLPKTLVRELVRYYGLVHPDIEEVTSKIVATPISPELIDPENGEIKQLTEDKIGPYELNDFFIYYYLRRNFSLKKILFLAVYAFKDKYDEETIKYHLRNFVRRFYSNQFKRSTLPDGPKITSISVSPRGDLRLPPDMSYDSLINELN
ncbi:MAG: NAD(+) synthase [Coprobacillus sp.]|nr:NAD(+) synthase [Coprobacillus sp.]